MNLSQEKHDREATIAVAAAVALAATKAVQEAEGQKPPVTVVEKPLESDQEGSRACVLRALLHTLFR